MIEPRFSFFAISAYRWFSVTGPCRASDYTDQVDRHLRGSNANAYAVYYTTSNQHSIPVASDLDSSSDEPKQASDEYSISSADLVG